MKSAILITSFGTSVPEARLAIENLVKAAKNSFPDYEIRLAFTSRIILEKLGREIKNPVEALAMLQAENFSRVIIMPTLMIPGREYDDLKNIHEAFKILKGKNGFEELLLGVPLLNDSSDCEIMAGILLKLFETQTHDHETGIVLMGHGSSEHFANALYSQLQLELEQRLPGKFFIGTVEAFPKIQDVINALKRHENIRKLILSPLMIVAGEHAANDLANTWAKLLRAEGYENISTYLKGLGDDKNVVSLFLNHLREIL